MSTFMAKAENVERKWYVLDAAGKPLGRTAATAAMLLRGKHKTTFTPHVDCGDFVIIVNADKAVLTGKKLTQKYYRHHTGWVVSLRLPTIWQRNRPSSSRRPSKACCRRTPSAVSPLPV